MITAEVFLKIAATRAGLSTKATVDEIMDACINITDKERSRIFLNIIDYYRSKEISSSAILYDVLRRALAPPSVARDCIMAEYNYRKECEQ